ncbi:ABC transporter permease [Dyadobacter bucti]|uniref:ABC transporter permease n=1 Tax=Dyadobacter bucti TaxID=2572203 RepID=UPI003F70CFBD
MIKNHLNIALRNLWKERLFSLISITGLGVGIAVSIIIVQFVIHEWSYDKFHQNGENIYRVLSRNEKGFSYTLASSALAPQLARENPEIKGYTRIYRDWSTNIKNPENPAQLNEETGFIFADQSLFSVFSFPLKYGNARNVLEKPFTVVISERMADKYFGNENPVGKRISYNGEHLFEITGVAKNAPTNSTITFDFVSSNDTFSKINPFGFEKLPNFETFLLIERKDAHPRIIRNIATANKLIATFNYNEKDSYELEALHALRLGSNYTFNEKTGPRVLYILSGIAVLILALALFNYINLATARSTLRAKEVGVRKSIGAGRFSLVSQFFTESALVTFIAFVLSIGLVLLFRDPFNNLFGLTIDFSFVTSKLFITVLVALFVASTILAGIYPALILSRFATVSVLKGDYTGRNQGAKARRAMMVFQFSVSATLILCSLVVQRQIEFMKDKDLGYNKDQLVNIRLSNAISNKSESFKKEVISKTGIDKVSMSNTAFFRSYGMNKYKTGLSDKVLDIARLEVDSDFAANLGLTWRTAPDKNQETNAGGYYLVLNETAVWKLGYTHVNAVGQTLLQEDGSQLGKVAGVVKNFNLSTPQYEIQPMLLLIKKPTLPANGFSNIQVRFQPKDDIGRKIAILERIYHAYDAESPFQYTFLDDDFEKAFKSQTRISYMVQIFTAMAISLACLGLFGLVTFIGQTRSKEISIRKIMGASVANIFSLLSRDFLILVLISVLIAIPVAYYCMDQWLHNFAYRIEISWWMFAAGGAASIVMALITISFQGFKAALANPADSLRSE